MCGNPLLSAFWVLVMKEYGAHQEDHEEHEEKIKVAICCHILKNLHKSAKAA